MSTDPAQAIACLLRQCAYAIEAGVDVLQVRERDLDARPLRALVGEIVGMANGSRTRVIVNDRLDVALAAGAGGVHLRAGSLPPAAARRLAPAGFHIGCSVHSLAEGRAAWSDADYLIAGTVWDTPSKPLGHPTLGLTGLAEIARHSPVPVLAIGGVTLGRLKELASAGAKGAAAIGLFMNPDGPAGRPCRAMPLEEAVRCAREV